MILNWSQFFFVASIHKTFNINIYTEIHDRYGFEEFRFSQEIRQ